MVREMVSKQACWTAVRGVYVLFNTASSSHHHVLCILPNMSRALVHVST